MPRPEYENVWGRMQDLRTPTGEERALYWVIPGRVAVGRTKRDSFELFLCGAPLSARLRTVQGVMHHDQWQGDGETFWANRLVLPEAPQFSAVASMIAVELGRAGAGSQSEEGLQIAFTEVEPLIELALQTSLLGFETQLGLIGELFVLEQVLAWRPPGARPEALESWRGHRHGERDFVFASAGLEVKSTLGEAMHHRFSGLHQVELDRDEGLEDLYVLSIRLEEVRGAGFGIPGLVEKILLRLGGREAPSGGRFLQMVHSYGSASWGGYDHEAMSNWDAYRRSFALARPPCLFATDDPDLLLLRSRDLEGTLVDPGNIEFSITFPEQVGPDNPLPDWALALRRESGAPEQGA